MREVLVIKQIELGAFKGFKHYRLTFNDDVSILVGPNNAGKSTIIGALRLCASLLDHARRRNPGDPTARASDRFWDYTITETAIDQACFNVENVYHEFLSEEAHLEVSFDNGGAIRVEWPDSGEPTPDRGFFRLEAPPATSVRGTRLARDYFPAIGVVPTLTPVEGRERLVSTRTVRSNYTTRLASSHFRNQMWHVYEGFDGQWENLLSFVKAHTPEISDLRMERTSLDRGEDYLDLYFRESISGKERELTWAGDGLQVWLQVMFHLWREREKDCLVLDEPDVYLHPDLQRRLVSVARNAGKQIIIATHSVEVLNELGPESAIAVDRAVGGGTRFNGDGAMAEYAGQVGSGLQLGLARALTRKSVLFVEGQDLSLLRLLAMRLNAVRVANEQGLATISIGGFSGWSSVSGFARVLRMVGSGPVITVLLDRDYRSDAAVAEVVSQISVDGAGAHVWKRKEIENYLLDVRCLARVAGIDEGVAQKLADEVAGVLKDETLWSWLGRRQKDAPRGMDPTTIARDTLADFNSVWGSGGHIDMLSGKRFIRQLNQRLPSLGGRSVNAHSLAKAILPSEVPVEAREFIARLELTLI
ncbi:AAA family ATPase [Micromonospora sp. NPDC005237]|uniref:ATP-dependent nuclease n=1 Tax=Micromonospora sp. NPDC005237 TaxID=3155113 RepID=UPI0033B1911A